MITQRPKGTQDWYGINMHKRTVIEQIARKICKTYNIKEVSTPVFEHTILFQRGVGETTDVVQKEMYTFEDKGGRSVTLKPEGTAGVVRAFIENSMFNDSQPTKMFYVTPAYRYEQPQSGRLREHHQFGVEIFATKSPLAEVELVSLVTKFLNEIGLKETKLHINSIGCGNCRKDYNASLMEFLNNHKDSLCGTCQERMNKNPLRVLDCKVPSCQEIVKEAPRTIDYLDDECREHFEELQGLLTELDIPFKVDTGIVRGLDYYTKTVFEFVNEDGFTLCGGGRYDNLVSEIDEKHEVPAVGFGMGIERIIQFLEEEGVELEAESRPVLYVGTLGDKVKAGAYKIVNALRNAGIIVETDYMDRSVRAQMKYANKINAQYTVIIGENELKEKSVNIKKMDTGEQKQLALDEIVKYFTEDSN